MNDYYEMILILSKKNLCPHNKWGFVYYKGYVIHDNDFTTKIWVHTPEDYTPFGEQIPEHFPNYIEALIWIDENETGT